MVNRRNVLKSVGTVGIGGISVALLDSDIVHGRRPDRVETSKVEWSADSSSEDVFPLSVMSGGPTDSGAILWTKVTEDAYDSSEPAYVQVSKKEEFSDPIYEGRIDSEQIKPENNHVIKTDLDGELPSDAHLYYRFNYDGTTSQTGRCRTLPEPDASVDSAKLAVVTCQSYQSGYYPAYNYIAGEDVDYIVHLGDQIYESAGGSPFEGRSIELPSGNDEAWTLEDYRHLWDTYRGDEFFQRALEQHSLIPTWDDHEIVNNPWWNYEKDVPVTEDHPKGDDGEFMTQLFVDAIQAWWEYNPARVEYDPSAEHLHDRFHMWRSIRFGDLLELPVTDERLFRSPPPGGDDAGLRQIGIPPNAPERDDADRTMLGFEQREWFLDTLKETDATWKAWANERAVVEFIMSFTDDGQFWRNYDAWDGYEHERKEILGQLEHFDVNNFLTFTGDWHVSLAARLLKDYEEAFQRTPIPSQEDLVGIEFMTPGLSSNGWASDFWGAKDRTSVESESPSLTNETWQEVVPEENPHFEFIDVKYNGYSIAEFSPEEFTWTTYAVDDTVDESDAARGVLRKYRVPEGTVDLEELEADDSPLPKSKGDI
jgi:alkaline phosphatase D